MKSLYKNNTHYNFSLRSLAEKIQCSPACLSHHLKILEQKGLITYHSNNITFKGFKKLQELYKAKNIGVPVDFKNQHDILRGQLIRFNLSAQELHIRKSDKHYNKRSLPMKGEKASNYAGLSAKGVGNLFNRSKETGSRIRAKLKKMRLLSVIKVIEVLFKMPESDYWRMKSLCLLPSYCYYHNGQVLIQRHPIMGYCSPLKML